MLFTKVFKLSNIHHFYLNIFNIKIIIKKFWLLNKISLKHLISASYRFKNGYLTMKKTNCLGIVEKYFYEENN
jgi:hypothetical protein